MVLQVPAEREELRLVDHDGGGAVQFQTFGFNDRKDENNTVRPKCETIPPGDIKLHRQSGDRGEHDKGADKEGRHSQQCHRGPKEADKDQVLGL